MRKLPMLIALLLFTSVVMAQTREISGVVKDSKTGSGVSSVTVQVKGKNTSAITNANGAFTLNVPAGTVSLEISSVGYATQSVSVGSGESSLSISLEQSTTALNEVVVTALGITKQSKKLGYSVTTVNGEQLTKARETNIANSLEGTVAGLSVRGTNSGPAGTAKLLLRGLPSMNSGGNPLYVINGVVLDNSQRGSAGEWGGSDYGDGISNINPDDVESMTVLKGQAASALYGARASNGVILITTKAGKKGKKDFGIEYNFNYMAEKAVNLTDFQYEYGQGDKGAKPTNQSDAINTAYSSWGPKLDGSSILGYDGKQYPYVAVKNNIQKFHQTSNSFTHSVALTKSSESGSFRLGGTYLDNTSIVRNSGLKRYSFNLNVDQNITDRLSLQIFANYIDQTSKNVSYLSDAPMNVNNLRFLATNIDQATLAPGFDPVTGEEMVVGGIYSQNPWFVVNKLKNDIGRKRIVTSLSLKYNLTSWLYAQGRVGYDRMNDVAFKVEPWGTAYRNTTRNGVFASGALQNQDKSETYELNIDGILGANKKFGEIELSAIAGANLRKNQYSILHLWGDPFIQRDFYSYSNLYTKNAENRFWAKEVHSAYYSVDVTYKGFLTLGTTGRLDAFSTLPAISNTIFVPSVTAGLIFSDLMTNKGALDYGKFRASYASTSGEPGEAYKTQIYNALQGNNYYGIPLGTYDLSLPNGLLKPFKLTELELGADLRFFGSRLNIDVSWFTKKTKNEIMGATLSRSSGYGSGYVGTGSTKNSGLEVMISGTVIKTRDFTWKPSFNFTKISSKVVQTTTDNTNINLGQGRETLGNLITAYVVGLPGPQILGYDYKRDGSGKIVVDASGIPLRTDAQVALGSALPTLYGGLNNEFTYKNLSLSVLIDYNFGNKLISMTSRSAISNGLAKETLVGRETGIVVDGVHEDGSKNTTNVDAQTYYTTISSRITALHVKSGDFVKLRQVAFSYNLPNALVQKTKIFKSAQVALTARNLLIIHKKAENIDPEESFGSAINYYGIEGRNLPSTRSIGVNLKVNF